MKSPYRTFLLAMLATLSGCATEDLEAVTGCMVIPSNQTTCAAARDVNPKDLAASCE